MIGGKFSPIPFSACEFLGFGPSDILFLPGQYLHSVAPIIKCDTVNAWINKVGMFGEIVSIRASPYSLKMLGETMCFSVRFFSKANVPFYRLDKSPDLSQGFPQHRYN